MGFLNVRERWMLPPRASLHVRPALRSVGIFQPSDLLCCTCGLFLLHVMSDEMARVLVLQMYKLYYCTHKHVHSDASRMTDACSLKLIHTTLFSHCAFFSKMLFRACWACLRSGQEE